MSVKIFLGIIILSALVTVTGFAYWLFPIVSRFNQALGGAPLTNPSGDIEQRINTWVGFLPTDALQRAVVISAGVAIYIAWTTFTALIAVQLRRRRLARQQQALSRAQATHAFNSQQ